MLKFKRCLTATALIGLIAVSCSIAQAETMQSIIDKGKLIVGVKTDYANTTGYKNDRVDKLLEEGRTTYDQAARKKIYDEIQEILVKDIPMFSLFYSVEYGALRDSVQGFAWVPDEIPRFRDLWKKSH